jgi:hypothetical protein
MGFLLAKGGKEACGSVAHIDVYPESRIEFEIHQDIVTLWLGSPINAVIRLREKSLRRLADLAGQAVQAYDDHTALPADGPEQSGELEAKEES